LAVRRAEEERALLALRIGQELLQELQKLGELASRVPLTTQHISALTESEPALLTLAVAQDGGLIFPWERYPDPSSALDPERLTQYVRFLLRGEEAEYRAGNLVEAGRFYGQATEILESRSHLDEAPAEWDDGSHQATSVLFAEARVHQARVLLRAERMEEARAIFRILAESPPSLADREQMPFSIYGLEGLHRSGVNPEELLPLLEGTMDSPPHFSHQAVLAWRDVALEIAGGVNEESEESSGELLRAVEEAVAQRVAVLKKLENLRRDFSGLVANRRGGRVARDGTSNPTWVPYGRDPWLVGVLSSGAGGPIRVAVVYPGLLTGPTRELGETEAGPGAIEDDDEDLRAAWRDIRFLPPGEAGGESLGPALSGLTASLPPGVLPPPEGGGVEGWFFRLLLPIILLLTGFTAFLAWRDVRRETDAVRLRSQFVSSVTHELKTPLTSIRMFAETLRLGRHPGPEVQEEYLDTIVHETERLSRLINNVLDLARIDRGEKSYHMATTHAGAAAREAARAVAYPLAQGRYTLTTDIPEDLPPVEADSDALTQALLNLLTNAIKFSAEGTEIGLRVLREGSDILLQVEDSGRGIAPGDQKAIFQDFFRTADAERDGIPGTGLGLPLVAHVAHAHGGRVEVESEVGRGSTFTLRIPVEGRPPDGAEVRVGTSPAPTLDPEEEDAP